MTDNLNNDGKQDAVLLPSEEETHLCATAFMAFLDANQICKPGDPNYNEDMRKVVQFYSFIFSCGFKAGITLKDLLPKEEKSRIIVP